MDHFGRNLLWNESWCAHANSVKLFFLHFMCENYKKICKRLIKNLQNPIVSIFYFKSAQDNVFSSTIKLK